MKKLSITIIALFLLFTLIGCDNPTATKPEGEPVEVCELIGQWIRNDEVITFLDNGNFAFHDYYTLDQYYYGFYIDYGDSVYLEVYADGVNMVYTYEIVQEYGDTILRWKSAGMVGTVDYLKIE